ncbi:lysozyme g-like isoform X1 [Emydura macquarii macquarii]|uniref:lysozyme g-like isoform X1 n=1 Tax=Emydura macquarii macquarii TaxID=1129001 RepID=UPI00352A3D18
MITDRLGFIFRLSWVFENHPHATSADDSGPQCPYCWREFFRGKKYLFSGRLDDIKDGTSESQTGCYGNVNNVDTTGASCATASPEGLSYCGVSASQKIAEKDLTNMNTYKTIIKSAGQKKCVDPAVIAAIISRESHAGTILSNGWGDYGYGFGLMQVDRRYHTIVGQWNSEEHLLQGTGILVSMIQGIQKKFPSWTMDQQLKGGISAYNAGLGNVQTYQYMDVGTTHNDYANDVVARAKYYKRNGY